MISRFMAAYNSFKDTGSLGSPLAQAVWFPLLMDYACNMHVSHQTQPKLPPTHPLTHPSLNPRPPNSNPEYSNPRTSQPSIPQMRTWDVL